MSISSEITRISNAKTAIAQSITNKGVTVPSGTKIDGMAALIDSIQTGGGGGDTSETWVLNEYVDTATQQTFEISFVSNGKTFSKLVIGGRKVPGPDGLVYSLLFDDTKVAEGGAFLQNGIYRKVTFAAAPTGGLLTWLEANGVKQASDTAVQPSKAVTVTSNGTTTITPDAPYEAIKQVDLTVNVASGGGDGFKITFPATATNWDRAYDARLLFSDGTKKPFIDYSSVSGQTIENVVGIICVANNPNYVLRMTLSKGKIAQIHYITTDTHITTAPGTTVTYYAAGDQTFWWPISDTVISSIQMYNTD